MFHGCVAFTVDSVDQVRWSSGSGPDPAAAKAAAARRLDNPGFFAVQCSDPPGIVKNPALNALPSPVPAAPPSMAELDQSYLAALNAGGIIITDVGLATQGAHEICSALAAGQSKSAVEADIMATNHTITAVNAATVVNSAAAVYCPQYGG